MQHHRRREPAKARVSPFLAVVGVMAVTTGVVGLTPDHTVGTGQEGLGAADSIRLPPPETTTTTVSPRRPPFRQPRSQNPRRSLSNSGGTTVTTVPATTSPPPSTPVRAPAVSRATT